MKPTLVLTPSQTPQACFEVRGLSPDIAAELRKLGPHDARWPRIFGVRVVSKTHDEQPAMLGSYKPTGDGVRFRPRFPLERGIAYRAVFAWPIPSHSPPAEAARASEFRLAETFVLPTAHDGPPTRVAAIYPSSRELPENLLRIYIQFSAPMSQGNCYSRVHLRDETAGTEVERPFLELPQELWSPDGTRLTLLLEPGRVKHDLVPREEVGPILVAGRNYSLTVDANWPDAQGQPLIEGIRKTFHAVKADARQLETNSWVIQTPPAGTHEPLSIRFPKALDRAMLDRVLQILPVDVAPHALTPAELVGTVRVTDEEKRWTFEPRQAWVAGRYVVAVSTRLEDPSGNSIGRPFEVDLKRTPNRAAPPAVVRIEFEVREPR
ncbi:MAG TPA: hypothetical protein VFG04_10400 [Planctomycetaceae bacterium]|nr:hypothetical protein [Planctomycetaceae bacterium]